MKKLITLAIAAFIFGAFSVANAQQPTPIVKGDKTNDKKAVVNTTKEIDAKTTLKETKEIDAKTTLKEAEVKTTLKEAKEAEVKTTLKEAEVKTTLKEAKEAEAKTTLKEAKEAEAKTKTSLKEANEYPVSHIIKKESEEIKVDWDMELKNYEIAVDQCITLFKATKVEKEQKALEKALEEFNNKLNEVEAMGSKIEKAKDELNRTQLHRYREAKNKLAVVYQKG
jgi:hypothetical protein